MPDDNSWDGTDRRVPIAISTTVIDPDGPKLAVVTTTIADASSIISAMAALVTSSTTTILASMAAQARSDEGRWEKHDAEMTRDTEMVAQRFIKVESCLDEHIVQATAYWRKERDADLVTEARISLFKSPLVWVVSNWKSLAAALTMFAALTIILADAVAHVVIP